MLQHLFIWILKLRAEWKGIWLQLFEICPRFVLMCFFRLGLQSFLERKSREAACFPSHGDWLNAASHGAVGAAVGKCTTTTPRCLKCVTSSLFGHNVLQSASSQFPCVPAQSAPSAVNKGARESERQHDCVCFLKMVSQWNIFSQWLLLFDIHAPDREREN